MAAGELDAPSIPLLSNNTVDPEDLNGGPLNTYANYVNPQLGDRLHQSWLGLAEDGKPVDVKGSIDVDPANELPEGFLMQVANHFVLELDKGQVFYSFFLQRGGEPLPGEESKRIHFGIGKHGLLSGPQIKDSHDLQLDVAAVEGSITIAVVPYGVMAKGDVVKLIWKGERSNGLPGPVVNLPPKTLSDSDTDPTNNPGEVLTWSVLKSNLLPLQGGRLTLHYEITYASPSSRVDTRSAQRSFLISPPVSAELSAARVKDLVGSVITPEQFPAGIRVVVPIYPGIRVGDEVLVYGTRLAPGSGLDRNTVQYVKVDATHIASGRLEVPIAAKWLLDNRGGAVSLRYQYARPDAAGSGVPLELTVSEALKLPTPSVDRSVTAGGRDELNPILAINGAYITIPAEATVGDRPVTAHWKGFGASGSHEEQTPSQLEPMKFMVPREVLPANFGKTVEVTYEVSGQFSQPSLELYIRHLTSHPGIVCEKVQVGSPATLKRSDVPDAGLVVTLDPWSFISTRHLVRLWLVGVGIDEREILPVREVLAGEVTSGVKTRLLRTHLAGIATNAVFTLKSSVSFDEGNSTVPFNNSLLIKLLD